MRPPTDWSIAPNGFGGYGNMVEIDHGKSIATRYGHMSKIVAHPGQRVRRGELIGYVGSTGRSTGPHLHYEVRIDGRGREPHPFLAVRQLPRGGDRTVSRRAGSAGWSGRLTVHKID